MNFQRQNLFVVMVSIVLSWSRVESIRFDLEAGHTKCIADDIKSNSMTVGKYQVVNFNEGLPLPDAHKITIRVTSSNGNNYHYAEHVDRGHFAFQAVEAGDYMACFFAADVKPSTSMTIEFDWKSGVAAKDWTNVAKKGSVAAMEIELKQMHDTVQSIHDEIYYLREREKEMQTLNVSTNSKMAWLSFLSLLVSVSVAGLQLWHLKSFFEKKKLI
ncbi:emp24/gp25L/p24 family/GOLD family protein [Perilla frutescens var. hirtella]|uniref:Emp24/gp25L/p24 family/GOLD family protein n=1 Tax=Perilla frutescens var. hirtella TaxID=608512 RepID=A0AAD4P0U3_PERFH|nr:emp24/gp25L/p24 family/GOLD family protein [Perilla frutescens var. hirtella]KAH6805308.1 emp24/gp25L/p24 family/GOLD family protein [Perilla frutescens var. frutescens]KAH6822429.1 emp24/gp25L/p24 family/GOLD family protein [Perilla frutescens var. hirtella]